MKLIKLIKLIKQDFDNAVKQRWHSNTCIVAQCMMRHGLINLLGKDVVGFAITYGMTREQVEFDAYYNGPEDTDKPQLQALRASLPEVE